MDVSRNTELTNESKLTVSVSQKKAVAAGLANRIYKNLEKDNLARKAQVELLWIYITRNYIKKSKYKQNCRIQNDLQLFIRNTYDMTLQTMMYFPIVIVT